MSFSKNLRELLDFKDIELKELSVGTGISKNTLDNYLSGQKSIPNADNAVKIAQYLNTTVEFLVTGENSNSLDNIDLEIVKDLKKLPKSDFDNIKYLVHALSKREIR